MTSDRSNRTIRTLSGRVITFRHPVARPIDGASPEEKINGYNKLRRVYLQHRDSQLSAMLSNVLLSAMDEVFYNSNYNEFEFLNDYDINNCETL